MEYSFSHLVKMIGSEGMMLHHCESLLYIMLYAQSYSEKAIYEYNLLGRIAFTALYLLAGPPGLEY